MPRQKKVITETVEVENEAQEIIVPILDASGSVGIEIKNDEAIFQKQLKKFGVYKDGEFLEEVSEDSESIQFEI